MLLIFDSCVLSKCTLLHKYSAHRWETIAKWDCCIALIKISGVQLINHGRFFLSSFTSNYSMDDERSRPANISHSSESHVQLPKIAGIPHSLLSPFAVVFFASFENVATARQTRNEKHQSPVTKRFMVGTVGRHFVRSKRWNNNEMHRSKLIVIDSNSICVNSIDVHLNEWKQSFSSDSKLFQWLSLCVTIGRPFGPFEWNCCSMTAAHRLSMGHSHFFHSIRSLARTFVRSTIRPFVRSNNP